MRVKSLTRFLWVTLSLGLLHIGVFAQVTYAPFAITNLGSPVTGTHFFVNPYDVAIYNSTNIYVAATYDYTIRKLTLQGGTNWVQTLLAGAPNQSGTNDGIGSAARFTYPEGVTVDKDNNVYVADSSNGLIRKITPDGNVTTIVGPGYLSFPTSIAVNKAGTLLYIADYGSNTSIFTVSTGGGTPSRFIGSAPGTVQYGGGIGLDKDDNLYTTDSAHHVIYKFTGNSPTIIAGVYDSTGTNDGIGSVAHFNVPNDIAVATNGDIYVTDAGNSTLRRIRFDGSNYVVRTIAGTPGVFGNSGGTGPAASFRNLAGVVYDDNTKLLYAADIVSQTIRVGRFVGPTNDFNIWTNTTNGKWEDAGSWLIDTPSTNDDINYITNALTKAVLIDSTTVSTEPDSLKINNLAIWAPEGNINGLVLFNSGTASPLQVAQHLVVDSGGVIAITNGAIKVNTDLAIGYYDGGALLNMYNGAKLNSVNSYVGLDDGGGNVALVDGPTSAWTNGTSLIVGYYSDGNTVLAQHGAALANTTGFVGQGGNNNNVILADPVTTWRNFGALVVGAAASHGNSLTIGAGASAYCAGLDIGTGGDSNVVTVIDAGSILTTSGPLRLTRGGQSIYNAMYIGAGATVSAPSITVSNGNFLGLAAGTLSTSSTLINNGVVFPVGVGVDSATLRLNGGTHTFVNGLQVTDHGVVSGCGTINGPVTIDPGGTMLFDCGTVTFNGPVTNNGTILPANGTNVVFLGPVVNRGSILTNTGSALLTCPIVTTGAVLNLNDSAFTNISDGTNSIQFTWSVASPGNSGYVYTTANADIANAPGITNVSQITNASVFTFITSGNIGPLKDAAANGGIGQFFLLRHKTNGRYVAMRFDDIQANGKLNASWWFQSQLGQSNFGCVLPPPPPGPLPATNFTMQASTGSPTLSFATVAGRAYTIQMRTNLTSGSWISITNFQGDGLPHAISVITAANPRAYFRVLTQ